MKKVVITDEYVRVTEFAGVKTYYRLGSKIEHEVKKYGTLPPKDFHKWAVICEHIVRHYTEGWADGFRYDMPYWEIWNEPDLDPDDSTHKRTWGGTQAAFFELYHIAATHLKACFPHLKIGGPALAGKLDWAEAFLAQLKAPLDFFSWHVYKNDPKKVTEKAEKVRGWLGDDWYYTLKAEKSLKGAAFIAGTMCECLRGTVDMLMYYDARPSMFNGMFNTDFVCEKLKGYYPFYMFNALYRLDTSVKSDCDSEDGYVCAACNGEDAAVMLTHFNDDDATSDKTFRIDLSGFGSESGAEIEIFVLDEAHDLAPVGKAVYFGNRYIVELTLPNYTSYLLKIKKL